MELKVIAYARNGHTDKFGIPRQSREKSPILTRIVFEPEYSVPEAFRGIEGFSHLWLLWGFSQISNDQSQTTNNQSTITNPRWSPTVRPPRLGGNKRVGVFATRSPFRPNPVGMSSVKLLGVQANKVQGTGDFRIELLVSGADLMDGTPIYDIKPYLSFSDCHEDAVDGFAGETKDYRLQVKGYGITENRNNGIPENILTDVEYILSQDPRPAYQDDPTREYKMDYAGWRVTFCVENETILVKNMEKI